MPRYFFDTDDGLVARPDTIGLQLENDAAARRAALDALPDMARETMPDGDRHTFLSSIRNEAGVVIYSATMSVIGRWHSGEVVPVKPLGSSLDPSRSSQPTATTATEPSRTPAADPDPES